LNFFFSVTLVQVDIMKGWGLLLTLAAVKKKKREREEKEERENRKEEREEGERARVAPEQAEREAERQSSETVVQPRDWLKTILRLEIWQTLLLWVRDKD
jgi:hypothetical protein